MKVLIAGATGLLAKPVIEHLDKQGFQVRLFSRFIDSKMFDEKFEIYKGDVFDAEALNNAVKGCDAVHCTMSKIDEASAVEAIIKTSKLNDVKLITYISGSTVSEENRWFPMIDSKMRAEEAIKNSGIPYMIFRPTWFFESLTMLVRDGKAMMIGKQAKPFKWVSADEFGRMIATAFQKEEARNRTFYIHGPEKHLMLDLLTKYAEHLKLKNTKVKPTPIRLLKFIAFLTGKKELKKATALFAYFEKVDELGDAKETNDLLGAPTMTFQQWLNK